MMDKLISQQAAIDALRKMQTYKLFTGDDMILVDKAQVQTELMMLPSAQPDDDRLERCRFEYVNACKVLAHRTPDTTKKDIADAYAVVRALNPIFGEEGF